MISKQHLNDLEEEVLDYYLTHYRHVHKVYCGSDLGEGCGELLALEVSEPLDPRDGLHLDERGVGRITIGDSLLSTRVRLDEHPGGRMVGYQCVCGNDTRLSQAEAHHTPDNGWCVDLMPHEVHQVRTSIKLCGHNPKFKEEGGVKHYESFRVEAVK